MQQLDKIIKFSGERGEGGIWLFLYFLDNQADVKKYIIIHRWMTRI